MESQKGCEVKVSQLPAARLKRVLTRWDLIVYGLAILTPTAAYPVFGVVQQLSNGHAPLSYLAAMVAMLFTALSYGQMSAAFPTAGSTYTFSQRALHPYVGFFAGWAIILDYVLVPMLSAVYVAVTAVRLVPGVPYFFWALVFCGAITLINVRGIQVTQRANAIMLAVMTISAAVFIALCLRYLILNSGWPGVLQPSALFNPATFSVNALTSGAAVATLSYLGFDAVSTLAEEAKNPRRDLGFATVTVCILQTCICFPIVYLAAVVWPDWRSFQNAETAILDISSRAGGPMLFSITTMVLLVAAVASSIASQAGAARLLFGMGRDGILPPKIFAQLHPKYATPYRSTLLMGAVSFLGAMATTFQLVVELVNFGAFVGFILVNLSVIAHYYVGERQRTGSKFLLFLIFPMLGAVVSSWVWLSLSLPARITGFVWLGLGALYLAVATRGFRTSVRSVELP